MFEINEEPHRSDCHVQNHAADARERHHSPRMAQYGRLGRNHRGAWAPMHLPRGAVRPNGRRAVPRRPHRIRRLAGMPRPRTQTDHSGRTQKIHPLMRLVPGAKTMHQALTQIRENTDSPAETHLRLPLKRYGFPEPIINVPVEATGNAAHGPAISDGLRPTQSARCRSARAPRQHNVLSPSRARPRCGGNRCRLRGRWARRRDRGDRRRSGCRS